MHVGLNKNHVSQLKPRLAHIAAAKKTPAGLSVARTAAHQNLHKSLCKKIRLCGMADSDCFTPVSQPTLLRLVCVRALISLSNKIHFSVI